MKEFKVTDVVDLGYSIPQVFQAFREQWQIPTQQQHYLNAYHTGQQSFIPNLLPQQTVQLSAQETLEILHGRLGEGVTIAIDPRYTNPDHLPDDVPPVIQSPVINEPDGSWLKQTNMAGINVRTVGSFWNIVKYTLTLPAVQDSIHILPIWEAGVVGSMYGMSSWQLNPEFYSAELANTLPHLNTIEKQLKAVVNLLHALGKSVGMDVIPHTDRYSQMSLAQPHYFEWLQRQDTLIIDHAANLHEAVQARIFTFLKENGPAIADEPVPATQELFFSDDFGENQRLRLLFGLPTNPQGRSARRNQLVKYLYQYGYEPVPATMAPPFRAIKVDASPEAKIVDANGLVWRDYLITRPEPMSRVFGPLARYKLYERLDDNLNWQVDFEQPREAVWDYICGHYHDVQRRYGFDFMRGDMSHVQMRRDGVPQTIDRYYDILGAVKNYIREQEAAYFGYFAETFLPPRDVMSYGEEMDHLEAADADTTLGDLQSTCVGDLDFMQRFRQYYDFLETRLCAPNFTIMTGDKDDPRFDEFYVNGNEARLFIAYFLTDMPSYMALGFEVRDVHHTPAPNEHYTKLYVFQETAGPKATHGPYRWGQNGFLYGNITRLRLYADRILASIRGRRTRWLLPPDPTGNNKIIAWTQADDNPTYLFIVNLDTNNDVVRFGIPLIPNPDSDPPLRFDFSTAQYVPEADRALVFNGKHYKVAKMAPGEGRVYRL